MDLNFIIPIGDTANARKHLRTGRAFTGRAPANGRILLLGVTPVGAARALSTGARAAQRLRGTLDALRLGDERIDQLSTGLVTKDAWADLRALIADRGEAADVLLLPWQDDQTYLGVNLAEALLSPPCDIGVVRMPRRRRKIRRILLPLRGGSFTELGARLAAQLARANGAEVTLLHVISHESPISERELKREFKRLVDKHPEFSEHLTVTGDAETAILREMKTCQAIILGASTVAGRPFSRLALKLLGMDDVLTMVTRTKAPFALGGPSAVPVERAMPVSVRVDKWFAERTFHGNEFSDLGKLIDLKRRHGLTISLGLPALNEAETVGHVIDTIKKPLMDEAPLLDEILLIDSNSTDGTREIAEAHGIPWVIHQQVLPSVGARRGKGEALWKSLHVLKGDLIAWVDTDIINIHPRFVYGILGPLLLDPSVHYVKGFYQRPIMVDGRLQATGGGRVTELLARPMFNLMFPELSGIAQPLSGEYAGRRSALERVPFYSGYGVETGLLLDLLDQFGLNAIAQVDLEERVHRNQELQALSKMSFAILQVFVKHLQKRGSIDAALEIDTTMKLLMVDKRNFFLEELDIQEHQRPPMIDLPEYLARAMTR